MNFVILPKNVLVLIAGAVWSLAGAMVVRIGLPLLWQTGWTQPMLLLLALIVFLIFYFLIFSRLVGKHTARIRANPLQRLPFWNFFDRSSYVVMVIMMSGGMWIRKAQLAPNWMIGFFYSGLGIALFACGVRFLAAYWNEDVLMSNL